VVYEAQHKFNEAVELYKKYIESHPGRVDMKLRLGKAYLQDRKYLESAKVMGEILRVDPTNREVRLTMGMAFFFSGKDYDRAAEEFRTLLKQDPFEHRARYFLALSYGEKNYTPKPLPSWIRSPRHRTCMTTPGFRRP